MLVWLFDSTVIILVPSDEPVEVGMHCLRRLFWTDIGTGAGADEGNIFDVYQWHTWLSGPRICDLS